MKNSTIVFIILVLGTGFWLSACKDDTANIPTNTSVDNRQFYPTSSNYEWWYEIITVDILSGFADTTSQRSAYNPSKSRMENYKDGQLKDYAFWYHSGGKLLCCNNRVLVDFNLLNCGSDSVKIFESNENTEIAIFQFCQEQKPDNNELYQDLKTVKTSQYNSKDSELNLQITNYFALGIGLVYREEISYANGIADTKTIQRLLKYTN